MSSEALRSVKAMLRARPVDPDATWEERREGMETAQAQLEIPRDVTCTPTSANGVPCEWVETPGADPERAVLYLHGGGYAIGSLATHRFLIQGIARATGCRALSVDYRLAPEHPFPAAVEDAATAARWLAEHGIAPAKTAIAGDSAGGGLTLATLLALRDAGDPLPACAVALSPWTDLTGTGESMRTRADDDPMVTADGLQKMAAAYAPGKTGDPLASPLFADLAGLPPLLIQVGTAEVLLDDSTRFAERAELAGVEVDLEVWDEMIHVFQAFPMLEEADNAIQNIGRWVRQRT